MSYINLDCSKIAVFGFYLNLTSIYRLHIMALESVSEDFFSIYAAYAIKLLSYWHVTAAKSTSLLNLWPNVYGLHEFLSHVFCYHALSRMLEIVVVVYTTRIDCTRTILWFTTFTWCQLISGNNATTYKSS